MLELALERGGLDNITIIVVRARRRRCGHRPSRRNRLHRQFGGRDHEPERAVPLELPRRASGTRLNGIYESTR